MTDRYECHVCGRTATWVVEQDRPAVVVKLDGSVVRFVQTWSRFYCDRHIPERT